MYPRKIILDINGIDVICPDEPLDDTNQHIFIIWSEGDISPFNLRFYFKGEDVTSQIDYNDSYFYKYYVGDYEYKEQPYIITTIQYHVGKRKWLLSVEDKEGRLINVISQLGIVHWPNNQNYRFIFTYHLILVYRRYANPI